MLNLFTIAYKCANDKGKDYLNNWAGEVREIHFCDGSNWFYIFTGRSFHAISSIEHGAGSSGFGDRRHFERNNKDVTGILRIN